MTLFSSARSVLLGEDSDETAPNPGVDLGTAIEAISSDRRRLAIREIAESEDDEHDLGDLADRLTAVEYGPDFGDQQRNRIYVGLYQSHVPRLEKDDLVMTFDDGTTIVPTFNLHEVYDWLQEGSRRFGGEA